jgi:hypothetical protein
MDLETFEKYIQSSTTPVTYALKKSCNQEKPQNLRRDSTIISPAFVLRFNGLLHSAHLVFTCPRSLLQLFPRQVPQSALPDVDQLVITGAPAVKMDHYLLRFFILFHNFSTKPLVHCKYTNYGGGDQVYFR